MGYREVILADNPRGYWRMGEASGLPQDSSGYANHATVSGGTPTYAVSGTLLPEDIDAAITLDGVNEYFSVPDSSTLDLGDIFTLEAWVRYPTKTGADGVIVDKNTNGYMVRISGTGYVQLCKQNVSVIVTSTVPVSFTEWTHVVATKTGATSKIYLNAADKTGTVTNATCADTTFALTIGSTGAAQWLAGTLDEVAVYGTALSTAQVLAHYQAARPTVMSRQAMLYTGLSSDTKPTFAPVGSRFYENDTGVYYVFAGAIWQRVLGER